MTEKRSLLLELLNEEVSVLTTQKVAVQTESGDLAEIPYNVEGIFIDFDDDYLLIEKADAPTLINRDRVIDITKVVTDGVMRVMGDPNKPEKGSMN